MAAGGRRLPTAGSGPPQPHSLVVLGCAQPTWRALGEEPTEGCALAAHLLCWVPAEPVTSGVAPDHTHTMCSKGPPQVWSTCSRCITGPALGQPRPCAPGHLRLLVLLHSPPNVSRWLWAQGLCTRWSLCLKDSDIPTPAPSAGASPPMQPILHGPFREPLRPVPGIWIQGRLVGKPPAANEPLTPSV